MDYHDPSVALGFEVSLFTLCYSKIIEVWCWVQNSSSLTFRTDEKTEVGEEQVGGICAERNKDEVEWGWKEP